MGLLSLSSFSSFFFARVEDEREFDYEEDSDTGPGRWGEIHPEWSTCKIGTMQSPIDMLNDRVQEVTYLGKLKRDYKPSNATLLNRGHDMSVRGEREGEILQLFWLSVSESILLNIFLETLVFKQAICLENIKNIFSNCITKKQ